MTQARTIDGKSDLDAPVVAARAAFPAWAVAAVAKRLHAGKRWVNRHPVRNPMGPMGGVRQSGFGARFSKEGLREHATVQALSIAR